MPQRLGVVSTMKIYAVMYCVYTELQENLDQYAMIGWRLHTIAPTAGGNFVLVFERDQEP